MPFEYNKEKSTVNKQKHGIDFEEAQVLWGGSKRIEIPAGIITEPRAIVIGMIDDKYWSAIVTYRDNNIRLISVRRSRKKEIGLYEKN